jgi:hypothetical protein
MMGDITIDATVGVTVIYSDYVYSITVVAYRHFCHTIPISLLILPIQFL